MGVVRTTNQRPQNRHIVRKARVTDATEGMPEPIEGRPTERVDSRELLQKLERELSGRARSPSDQLEVEVTTVRERPGTNPGAKIPMKMSPARLAHTMRRGGAA